MSNKSDILFESLTSRYELKKDEIKQEIVETRARLKYLYKQLYLENKKNIKEEQESQEQESQEQVNNNKEKKQISDEEKFVISLLKEISKNESVRLTEAVTEPVVKQKSASLDKVSIKKSNVDDNLVKINKDSDLSAKVSKSASAKKNVVSKIAELVFGKDYYVKKVLKSNKLDPKKALYELERKLSKLINVIYNNNNFIKQLYKKLSDSKNHRVRDIKKLSVEVKKDENKHFSNIVSIKYEDNIIYTFAVYLGISKNKSTFELSAVDEENSDVFSDIPIEIKNVKESFNLDVSEKDVKEMKKVIYRIF